MVRRSATWQLASIVGPVLGGVLYAVDVTLPFVAVVGFLLLAAVAMFAVRPLPAEETAVVDVEVGAAADEAADVQAIKAEAMLEAGVEMSEGAVIATAPARGRDQRSDGRAALHPAPAGAARRDLARPLRGALRRRGRAAPGDRGRPPPRRRGRPGLVAGRHRHRRRARHPPPRVEAGRRARSAPSCSPSVAVFGVFTIVLGVTTSFVVAFVALLVLSGADSVSVFIRATLVPLVTPNEMRGRVLAVENVFIGASNELGAFESGVVGQLFGTVPAVVFGGAATLAVAGDLVEGVPRARARSIASPGA